jgi:flagellar basal-body rod protein FlgF
MDNAGYVGLSRQAGLSRELTTIANNLANMNTNGFRRESAIFAEYVSALSNGDSSLSVATQSRRFIDTSAGEAAVTNAPLDMAISGDGFFLVEAPSGERLTRDGAFSLNAERELVTAQGFRVLDEGGSAIVIPPGQDDVAVSPDGSISANGQPVARIGVVTANPAFMVREGNNMFRAETGFEQVADPRVQQGVLEGSNVNAIEEMARLIEVQRAYQASKSFIDDESERISRTIRTLGRSE